MIFVTAGTTNFPFRRLERLVEKLQEVAPEEEIIFQNPRLVGFFPSENTQAIKDISQKAFEQYLKSARIIITHAGYATTMQSLRFSKSKPLLVPRRRRYGEHVNDHQLFFARYMEDQRLISIVEDPQQLERFVGRVKQEKEKVRRYMEKVKSRRKKLVSYLGSIA